MFEIIAAIFLKKMKNIKCSHNFILFVLQPEEQLEEEIRDLKISHLAK